jgi:alginate O-acetyltransferase complex protein AlgI
MLTMLLGGLWHGAAWTFIAWGALHGGALAIERALGLEREGRGRGVVRLAWFAVVQVVILLTWILFRSDTIANAARFVANIAAWHTGPRSPELAGGLVFLAPIVLHHLWRWLEERETVPALAPPGKAVLAGSMALAIVVAYGSSNDFIYFQF